MKDARSGAPGGIPILVQITGLLLATLLVAQCMSILVLVATPPPRPPLYRLSEVADALKGGSLDARLGKPMLRSRAPTPPAEEASVRQREERARLTLAGLLQTPETRVRLTLREPSVLFRVMRQLHGRRPPGPPPRGMEMPSPGPLVPAVQDDPPPPSDPASADPPPPPPDSPGAPRPGPGYRLVREVEVIGEFTAALQGADGQWTVVRSPAEPFANAWHLRIAIWLFGCLLVLMPAGYLFARRISAPVRRFANAADALGRDPLALPIAVSGPAELGAAARAFNDMQERIRRFVADRTAMVGAISHDLRTPLARIRYKVEGGPEPLKAAVLSDVAQMEQMLSAVLAFIRDASEPRRRERIDLLSLLECAVDDAVMTGADAELLGGHPLAIEGDALALQRMFDNLLDNTSKHAVRARVRLHEEGGEAVVEIEDDGPGLPEDELERVFQPFYRVNEARTLDATGGVGLGLAIARSTARAHGGDITLHARDGGLTAIVRLPLAR